MEQTALIHDLEAIAQACKQEHCESPYEHSNAYEIASGAIAALAKEIGRTKPRRTKKRSTKQYGHTTLALLSEKYVGPAWTDIMALHEGEDVRPLKWPEDTTVDEFQRVIRLLYENSKELSFSQPIGRSLTYLARALSKVAHYLPNEIDYRRPVFCGICFKHTDPNSKSKYCLDHLRSSGRKSPSEYQRGKKQSRIALSLLKDAKISTAMKRFYKDGMREIVNGTNADFIALIRAYCPKVGCYITADMATAETLPELVAALGQTLKDPFLASWFEYVDRRYRAIQPDLVYDPDRIQFIDPELTERELHTLRIEWAAHGCEWIVRAEIYSRAESELRPRGRPRLRTQSK